MSSPTYARGDAHLHRHHHQRHSSDHHASQNHQHHQNDNVAPRLATSSSAFPDLFDDANVLLGNRRSSLALPRIEAAEALSSSSAAAATATAAQPPAIVTSSATSSRSSSPYASPRLPPKTRIGSMGAGEITLPPLSSAVPMRRGAVSGESSGPSLPFPPIRLPPHNEEDIPSRGPSPTLGKRPSFSLGHSNHVPPGPNAHLPMPALIGSSNERRAGPPSQPPPPSSSAPYYPDAGPESAEQSRSGAGYYYNNPNVPRPSYNKRGDGSEEFGGHGSYGYASRPSAQYGAEEPPYYSHHPQMPPGGYAGGNGMSYGAPRYAGPTGGHPLYGGSGGGRYEHDGGPYAMGGPRQMSYGLSMSPDDHLMPIAGKRPRSAPRVLSSQPRIFACSQCPARFARNHDLKRHQRGHLSVRPYPCTWCGKSFSRKDALKRHVLVKGCGKDKSGGGGGGDAQRKSGSSGGEEGGSGGTDRSRSDAAGDRDDDDHHHDDDQSDGDEEDDAQHHQQPYNQSGYGGQHTYPQAQQSQQADHHSLYRWNKPSTMPSLASQAATSFRIGDFASAASSFAGFAATRRPSASIA